MIFPSKSPLDVGDKCNVQCQTWEIPHSINSKGRHWKMDLGGVLKTKELGLRVVSGVIELHDSLRYFEGDFSLSCAQFRSTWLWRVKARWTFGEIWYSTFSIVLCSSPQTLSTETAQNELQMTKGVYLSHHTLHYSTKKKDTKRKRRIPRSSEMVKFLVLEVQLNCLKAIVVQSSQPAVSDVNVFLQKTQFWKVTLQDPIGWWILSKVLWTIKHSLSVAWQSFV